MNKKTLIIIIVILLLITTGILGYCLVNKKEDVNVKELVEDIESIRENDKIIHAKEKEPYTIPSTYYGDGYYITVSLNRDSTNYFIYVNNEEIYHYIKTIKHEE